MVESCVRGYVYGWSGCVCVFVSCTLSRWCTCGCCHVPRGQLVRQTSAVTKTVVNSCSVVLSSTLAIVFLGAELTAQFVLGAAVVTVAVYAYMTAPAPEQQSHAVKSE